MIARALLVAGLGFGDEGKGSLVDWLARKTRGPCTVVRYNGGPQAAHHVVTSDGRSHCFAQFGAGTLVPGVKTFVSRFTIFDPLALEAEERALCAIGVGDGYARLTVDPACVIVTPFHRILNQMREVARGDARHGSCGLGIAEARLDSERPGVPMLRVADISDAARLAARLRLIWLYKLDLAEQLVAAHPGVPGLEDMLADLRRRDRVAGLVQAYRAIVRESGLGLADAPARADTLIFEGAQGVLLDRELGFWPYMTPSKTTFEHAHTLLAEWGGTESVTRWGVMRAYATRHGAGPLPTEDRALSDMRPDVHNGAHPFQGAFRLGWFDALCARYALSAVGGVERLMISNLDRLAGLERVRVCTAYHHETGRTEDIPGAPDLEAQRARTRWLKTVRPHYQELAGWPRSAPALSDPEAGYLDALAEICGARGAVRAYSIGATAADKYPWPA